MSPLTVTTFISEKKRKQREALLDVKGMSSNRFFKPFLDSKIYWVLMAGQEGK